MNQLFAGTGRCDITPAPGTPQGGWGAQTHQRGLGADMPFYATALVLSDGQTTAAIIDLDAIGFDREWTDKILAAVEELSGLKREFIRLSCTHTHSGPNTFRLAAISEGLDMALSYLDGLPRSVASAVWQAQKNLKPVRCAAGAGSCKININRRLRLEDGRVISGRNWQGVTDPTVRVVRFDDPDQKAVATIVHYACHGTTMAWQTQLFTPDFPGPMRKAVEDHVGGACLFLQGAAANLMPRHGYTGDCSVYRRLGTILGLEASRVALEIETLPRRERFMGVLPSGAPIGIYEDEPMEALPPVFWVEQRTVPLPANTLHPPDELQTQADTLIAQMNRLRREGTQEQIRSATAQATQALWRAGISQLYYGKGAIDLEMQCIRLGSIALLSVPGEPFIETGLRIVKESPFQHTLFSGYSNGGFGYIPTREAFLEGGYEVEASPFSPNAEDVLVAAGVKMLRDVAGK